MPHKSKQIKTKVILLLLLVLGCHIIWGQNLLLNPNFEEYSTCPTGLADFNALYWNVPTAGTSDYLHECGGMDVSIPSNFVGFQASTTGAAYAGIITYYKGLQNYREYIQAELTSPTIKGACYQLAIVYSSADFKGDSNGLGMFLSEGIPTSYLDQPSQMEKSTVIESKTIWNTLTMQYVSPGGETHVTIGNFNNDSNTSYVIPPDGPSQDFVYYYIDSIGIVDLSIYTEEIVVDLGEDLEICASEFPITLTSNVPNGCNIWNTGEVGNSIEINDFGQYYLRVNVDCEYGLDTIVVSEIEAPLLEVNDLTICEGQDYLIELDETLGDYVWDDGTEASDYLISLGGHYGLTLSYECGDILDDFSVEVIPVIEIPSINDLALCENELPYIVDLSAYYNGANQFLWSDGTDLATFEISEIGEYYLQVSNDCFSEEYGFNVEVSSDFPSIIDFTDTIACLWEDKVINLGFDNADFKWDDGSHNPYNIVTGPGTYSVSVSNYCRTQVFEFEIDEAIEAEFDLGEDLSICPGDSVLVFSPSGEDVNWSTGEISSETWVKEDGPLVGEIAGLCGIISDTILINFNGMAPELSVPDSLLLCDGDTLLLSASENISGVEFMWNTGSESAEIEIVTGGTYVVSGENNCGIVVDSVVVVLGEALPDPNLLDIYEICEGDSIELTILTNGSLVEWSTGALDSMISVNEAGIYSVSLTNSCKTKTDSFTVSYIQELSDIDLGMDVAICEDGSTLLEYSGVSGEYMWNTGEESESIEVVTAGLYWLEISGICNLVSDTIEVLDLGTAPIIDLGPDLSFCDGDTVEISVGSADVDEVIWNTSSMENTISVTSAGTYIVIGSNVCGSDSDTLQATINNEVPQIDLGTDQVICPGDSVLIETGGVAGDIVWSTGEEGSSIYVDATGTYVATLSSSCGESVDSVYVEVSAAGPTIDLGEDVELCAGESLDFDIDIGEGIEILWNNGDEDGTTSFTETGTIWLELSNDCGEDRDSMELVIIPMIAPYALPADITICDEESYIIESNITQEEIDLEWNTSETGTTIEVSESSWYWIEATNECFALRDSIRIDFYETAMEFDLGLDDTICSGQSIILSGDQGEEFDYVWQDNSEETDFIVTETGTYILEVSNECGTFSDEVDILVIQTEEIENPLNELYVLCNDVPLSIDLSNVIANSILWSDGSTEVERIFEEPGVYFVELANACSETIFNFEFEQKNCLTEIIYLPNTFSPNNDGVNDYFSIYFPKEWESPKLKIQIYNRWGEEVFYSDDPFFNWDGTFKGIEVNQAVYAFYFELEVEIDGKLVLIKEVGTITVLN